MQRENLVEIKIKKAIAGREYMLSLKYWRREKHCALYFIQGYQSALPISRPRTTHAYGHGVGRQS